MRLINTETMLLEDFTLLEVPHYAILSHTWTNEEVTLQEFARPNSDTIKKQGFAKITQTCKLAQADNLRYAWVDTCCIDKTSNAELTEAINSMFQWYKNASVCYAFLSDFRQKGDEVMKDRLDDDDTEDGVQVFHFDGLMSCRWFTRGWTLQELIAPETVRFYDQTWTFRGTKVDYADAIYLVTRINPLVLRDSANLSRLSIAERFAWASGRRTTRLEDAAYCLLGLFSINMPLLYGEGDHAFIRLQEEIIKNNNDLSIFGWGTSSLMSLRYHPGLRDACEVDCDHDAEHNLGLHGVLAPSLSEFAVPRSWYVLGSVEHTVTNRGIKIHCSLLEMCLEGCDFWECRCCAACRKYVLPIAHADSESRCGIVLDKWGPDTFVRSGKRLIHLDRNAKVFSSSTRQRPVYLLTRAPDSSPNSGLLPVCLPLRIAETEHYVINSALPDDRWSSDKRCWYIDEGSFQDWGMLSLEFDCLRARGQVKVAKVCILFLCETGAVAIFDPRNYKGEIALISQSTSALTWGDVFELFDFNSIRLGRMAIGDEGQQVRASVGNPRLSNYALAVWVEEATSKEAVGNGAPSAIQSTVPTSPSPASINSSTLDNTDAISKAPQPSPLPAFKEQNPTALNPPSAATAPTAKAYNPADSVQAVIVRCKAERQKFFGLPWCATVIPAHHPVFSQTVPPIPALIGIPLVLSRIDMATSLVSERSGLDNQIATYLTIDDHTGFAPPQWQSFLGNVVVARKDRKPLLPAHVEVVWEYCAHILNLFGDGDGAPRRLYNRQAFEKFWKSYSERRQKDARSVVEKMEGAGEEAPSLEWATVTSPYDV